MEQQVRTSLDAEAERIDVDVDALWRQVEPTLGGRRERRRDWAVAGAVAAALVLVVGAVVLLPNGGSEPTAVDPPVESDGEFVDAAAPSVNLVPEGYEGRFRTTATVLESPQHGPQLCYSVLESLPPQCGGPDIAEWDWSSVEHESANGTRWGYYAVVGTFDGETFTLTEPPSTDPGTSGSSEDDLATPCPEPEGGWQPVDPATATQAALHEAIRRAEDVEGFGGVWVDQRIPADELTEQNANDPKRLVLNVTTAGDPEEMQRVVREVWGGSLCVSTVDRTDSYLRRTQRDLRDTPGILSSSIDVVTAQVDLTVLVATHELQQQLDARYGAGTVRLIGALDPID
jgi:hypothetical protein